MSASHLYGVHDSSSDWAGIIRDAGMTGWAVISESIGADPNDHSGQDYRWLAGYHVTPIVRLNYSHHGQGSIPQSDRYDEFAARCANFVSASSGCTHWIIGNETNWADERPGGVPIEPTMYADCFVQCRRQIRAQRAPGGAHHQCIVAAVAPYNEQSGWCIDYWRDVLSTIVMQGDGDVGAEGLAIHTYSRGGDPSSIFSEDKMNPPHDDCYNGFRAYRDFLGAVPAIMRGLPAFITETDQIDPWADVNSGWVEEAYAEISAWNQGQGHQGIHALCLYRWEKHDQWYIEGKHGVINDFRDAVRRGYQVPITPTPPTPTPTPPEPPRPTPAPEPEPIDWDPRLTVRDCSLQAAHGHDEGEEYQRLTVGRWFNKEQAQNRINIFVRVLTENGQLAIGIPVTQFWSSGSYTKPTERKADPWLASMGLGAEYSLDFPMNEVAPSYGIRIDDGHANDIINGCGLGSIEQPDYKIHTAYFFEWQLSSEGMTPPLPPIPLPRAEILVWPVVGPITQYFGRHEIDYSAFNLPGHDGLDFGVPSGTPVIAVADGIVKWVDNDPSGFGLYVRIFHPAHGFHSFMGHLSAQLVTAGQRVTQGETIGKSGSTGNSTGPHLHYSTRIGEEDTYFDLHDGYHNGCANPLAVHGLINKSDPNMREEA